MASCVGETACAPAAELTTARVDAVAMPPRCRGLSAASLRMTHVKTSGHPLVGADGCRGRTRDRREAQRAERVSDRGPR